MKLRRPRALQLARETFPGNISISKVDGGRDGSHTADKQLSTDQLYAPAIIERISRVDCDL